MADIEPNDLRPQDPKNPNPRKPKVPQMPKFNFYWIYGVIFVIFLATLFFPKDMAIRTNWVRVQNDMIMLNNVDKITIVNEKIAEVTLKKEAVTNEKYKDLKDRGTLFGSEVGPHYYFEIGDVTQFRADLKDAEAEFQKKTNTALTIPVEYTTEKNVFGDMFLTYFLPILLLLGLWLFLMRRMGGGGGGGGQLFNIGKSKAQLFDKENLVKVTFKDVAGLDEAKVEIMEIVDFLKNPKKYTNLGGKIPKGALLVGPPGTGKTLLAKAVAGEAGVPFFSLSGSDFVEMFVGVGAARVRDLFKQAKEKAPCIIFIDEIDAVGRSRGRGSMPGGNDERENTLNSLLVEMDGFATDSGIIIMAATNRPDVLDPALLRPGRFDRQISIDKPDIIGREAIFKVHLKPLKLAADTDPKELAAQTPGFAGAEIANVCNEAALIAARRSKTAVDMNDFQEAMDRVIGGLEKKNKLISPEEKKIVAFHEAGHAIAGWFLEHANPLVKVSIVPRGVAALGYAQYLPKEQFLYRTEQLMDEMCVTLGGRAAEEIVFGKISTGAQNDLERITKLAYSMVTIYGMNEKLGNISYYDSKGSEYQFNKPYSETTAREIDEEVRKIIKEAYDRTKKLLKSKQDKLTILAEQLLQKEVLFQSDLEALVGPRPFEQLTSYQEFIKGETEKKRKDAKDERDLAEEKKNAPAKAVVTKKASVKKAPAAKAPATKTPAKKPTATKEAAAKPRARKPKSTDS
jgi:AFG3 family protein